MPVEPQFQYVATYGKFRCNTHRKTRGAYGAPGNLGSPRIACARYMYGKTRCACIHKENRGRDGLGERV